MDGQRSNYPEEPTQPWYGAERGYESPAPAQRYPEPEPQRYAEPAEPPRYPDPEPPRYAEQAEQPRYAEQPTSGRQQAERVPLLKPQQRYPDQQTQLRPALTDPYAAPAQSQAPAPEERTGGYAQQPPAPAEERPGYAPPQRVPQAEYPSHPTEQIQVRRPVAEPIGDGDGVYRSRRPAVAIVLAVVAGLLAVPALVLLVASVAAKPIAGHGIIAGTLMLLALPAFAAGMYGLITGAGHASERIGARVLLRPPLAYLVIGVTLMVASALAAG